MILPVKLSGHTMTPAGQIRPSSMSLNWRINGLSNCTMTLELGADPALALGDWVLITAPMGHQSGVFYVKNVKTDYVRGVYTVTLEHTFGLLQEMVAFGEITPETIGGTGTTSVTSTAAITYLLSRQTEQLWTLYENDFASESQGWKFQYQDIYTALDSISSSIPECQWEFDQSVFPWRLSLKAWPTATTMEMRKNRNIESMSVTVDRSNMFTRVYPTGKKDLHIGSVNSGVDYLEKNTATWGVISKTITDSSIDSASLLKAWAQAELDRNAEPAISVSVGGIELSAATGESLDALTIGRLCRIPLPEYSTTVTERIVELAWRDCIISEESVTVTLANELRTIQSVLYELTKSGHTGKKSSTSKDCDLHDHEEHLEEFDNADIWVNRESVWAVCGAYTVYTDGNGVKHLKVNEGAALTIERNHTELGIYDQGNLTGGIVAQKINEQTGATKVKIKADMIELDGETIADMIENQEISVNNKLDVGGYFSYQTEDVSWCSFIIDGETLESPMFLGTGDLSFSVADTQIYRTGVSAAGALRATWSGADVDHQYNDTYTVTSGTNESRSVTVSMRSGGWTGVSAGHAGTCTLYATAGGADRAQYLITGNAPYQQGLIDGAAQTVTFEDPTYSGSTYDVTSRDLIEHLSNGSTQSVPMRITRSAEWAGLDTNTPFTSAWLETAAPGTSNYAARMRLVIYADEPYSEGYTKGSSDGYSTGYSAGYSVGYSEGQSAASAVTKNDITVADDSTAWGVDSQPNADTRVFALSGRTITQLGKWYRFKVTVKGVTKTYTFKTIA